MADPPSPSPPLPGGPDPLQSGVGTPPLNGDTPIQPDSETAPHPAAVQDPTEENSAGEEEDDDEDGEEMDEETSAFSSTMDLRIQPPTSDGRVSASDVTLASPTARRGGNRRKKGKGKGKGKPHAKKMQVIEIKLRKLRSNLNPVPFIPRKLLDVAHHEKLLKRLGLWEFVHIVFDREIRVDLIAQLVANYHVKSRGSYVNGFSVKVNRTDLGRALNLPLLKKEKGNAGEAEVDLDPVILSEDSVGFIEELVSDWMLLHEDMWMTPKEVIDWMKLIKEGRLEKVDWAGLLWFMVEKELKQGAKLKDCYYASHLQHLIKHQRKDVFLMEEPANGERELGANGERELGAEDKVVEDGDDDKGKAVEDRVHEGNAEDSIVVETREEVIEGKLVVEGPSTELTLGKDGEKEEGGKEVEIMDAEKCKDSDDEVGGEGDEREEKEQWLLNGKNNMGERPVMQHCTTLNTEEFGSFGDRKDEGEEEEDEEMDGEEDGEEDEEEEARNDYNAFQNDDSLVVDGFTGDLLQVMEGNQMAFAQEQLPNSSSLDVRANVEHIGSAPSFFNNSGKRVIEHDYHHRVNDSNKRLRINETWDNKPVDFAMCMEQIQQMAQRARMLYEEKEQSAEQSGMNQQILLNEVQKRDAAIEHLHKIRIEEGQKKDIEIARLERELYLMGSVLDGYRKCLKEERKVFAEYREKVQLAEESTYKDVGPGGLMLTAAEIERCRKKKEEEDKMQCLFIEQKIREMEEDYNSQFDMFFDKINRMDRRLSGLEVDANELIDLHLKKKFPKAEEEEEEEEEKEEEEEEEMHEAAETLPVPEPDEPVIEEVSQPYTFTGTEEERHEAAETLPVPEPDEPVIEEVSQPYTFTVTEEEMHEAADDDLEIPQSDEKAYEAADDDLAPLQRDENADEAADDDLAIPQSDEKAYEVADYDLALPQRDENTDEAADDDIAIAQSPEKACKMILSIPQSDEQVL